MATLVIVSGAPASGKTTLARQLAHALTLPMISRDAIKEALFDTLGWRDRARSRELGDSSSRVMFVLLAEALTAGADCIAEGTFRPSSTTAGFRTLLDAVSPRTVQVHCTAEPDVLIERFSARMGSSDRHPGHNDMLDEFRLDLQRAAFTPLPLEGPTLIVDSTRPPGSQWTDVIAEVASLMAEEPRRLRRNPSPGARGWGATPPAPVQRPGRQPWPKTSAE